MRDEEERQNTAHGAAEHSKGQETERAVQNTFLPETQRETAQA